MCIKDFNLLSLDDKISLVNKTESKLLESHLWVGNYKMHLYEMDGMKVHVLVRTDNNRVIAANALEDAELEPLSDSIYLN